MATGIQITLNRKRAHKGRRTETRHCGKVVNGCSVPKLGT